MQKKMLNKLLIMSLVTSMALVGCGGSSKSDTSTNEQKTSSDKPYEGVELEVWSQRIGAELEALEEACEAFEEETGIKVDFNAPGTDYENLLRMKMAANEMPDIWSTHGWAVNRYSEVLADLSGEQWVSRTVPSILSQVTDADGRVLSMCVNASVNAFGYNPAIFEEYGLEIPNTVDELYDVCAQIVEKSGGTITPIHIGGGDGFPIAKGMDYLSSTLTITDPNHNFSKELIDGTFDWENYRGIGDFFKTLKDNGYVNVDVLTATNDDTSKAMASGEAAIALTGWNIRPAILTYNPEAEFGFFPIPAYYEGDQPVVIGGETDAWGVSKNTENMEAAKLFLEYFAQPDVNKALCEKMEVASAFSDVTPSMGEMTPYFEAIKDLRVEPFFDRVYLPSGMWDGMQRYGQLLFTDDYTVDNFLSDMETEYLSLHN